MRRVAIKGLLQRKLRALMTALAVVLGVAMVSGTFMLTDSIQNAFTTIFDSSYSKSDAVVSGRPIVEGSSSGNPTVPAALLPKVRALPGVDAAAGGIADLGGNSNKVTLVDRDQQQIGGRDAPSIGMGADPAEPRFIPLTLSEGEWADAPDEVVLDAATANGNDYAVGDSVGVIGHGPVEQFTVSGIATFGDVESLGGATIAVFDLPTAQRLLDKHGFDTISVAAADGTSVDVLMDRIRAVLPEGARVESGSARAAKDSKEVSEFIEYLRFALVGFGGIALFVGAFVIFNTLSITVAQRTRELATLRTIGASRRQVLRSMLLETGVIGVVASLTGLALGLGLASGLKSVFDALGLGLPDAGTIVATRTVVVSLAVGIAITLIAGLVPAIRATRVAPIEAVREGATAAPTALSRRTPYVAAVVSALALGALSWGMLAPDVSVQGRLGSIALGSLGLFIGVAMIAPRLVRPLAALVGWPAGRLGGAGGRLARRNAVRNPGRTAATAAALMIGLTLVTAVAVLGEGLRSSLTGTVERQVTTGYVVQSASGFDRVPVRVGRQLAKVPGIESSSVRSDSAKLFGATATVTGVDEETIARHYAFRFSGPSEDALSGLADGGAIVRKSYAEEHDLHVGSPLRMTSPSGETLDLHVSGVLDQGKFDLDPLLGTVVISQAAFDRTFPRPGDLYTFVRVGAAAAPFAGQAIEQGTKQLPGVQVLTRDEFVESRVSGIGDILNLLYVLLALSVVVSLFGMVNTLVLAVFERTRELGMLRAVGLTRRQTRAMVRHESVITALIGAAIGLPLGIMVAALVTRALEEYDIQFAVPAPTLAAFVVISVAAGIVAAILPARRASRLDVLRALQYE
jgi:putative ABC transport system permease protein